MENQKAINKNFKNPDEVRQFAGHGRLELVSCGENCTVGKGIFESGWKWSNDVKPLAQTESCEASHTGYCLSGSMVIKMNSGEQFTISAGDAFYIPPGHDAWVEGDQRCELIDVTGFQDYAKPASAESGGEQAA